MQGARRASPPNPWAFFIAWVLLRLGMPKNPLPSFLPGALHSLADTLAAMPKGKPSGTSEAPTGEGKASPKTTEGDAVGGEASMEGEAENMALNDVIIILLKGGEP